MFGMDQMISDLMSSKLEETLAVIRQVMEQFQNPVRPSLSLLLREILSICVV